jgi:hypothetical protein
MELLILEGGVRIIHTRKEFINSSFSKGFPQ